jgi:hypothetical protein
LRLDPRFRFALYAAFFALFTTGIGWLLADKMKEAPSTGEAWQMASAYLLMIHGGAAMVAPSSRCTFSVVGGPSETG